MTPEELQMIISEPVESFGTPELIAWAEELHVIIAKYPESERGDLPFVMLMGCHLEKFAKSWNCAAMKQQAEQIRLLEDALVEERSGKLDSGELHWQEYKQIVPDLIADVKRLQIERDDFKQKYQFMVDNAARQKLDGYRELGARAANAENQRDEQAAYLARLEAAYLDEARENIQATKEFLQDRQTPEEYQAEIDRLARAALARIKGDE